MIQKPQKREPGRRDSSLEESMTCAGESLEEASSPKNQLKTKEINN